jgi:transposase
LPARLQAQISRELDRIELLTNQLKINEAESDALLDPASEAAPTPGFMLAELKGIGSQIAVTLWFEAFYPHFDNRRQVAAYAGLAPTPWKSGSIDHE